MKNILKVDYEYLEIKTYKNAKNIGNEHFDLDRNFNLYKILDNKKTNDTYSVIIYEGIVGRNKVKLLSPKLNIDEDSLKIKLYMKGFVNIKYENNFTSYHYELDFLN